MNTFTLSPGGTEKLRVKEHKEGDQERLGEARRGTVE